MKPRYPKVIQLPLGNIPREIRDKTPDLVYQPSHRLTNGSNMVQVAQRVLAAYPGWAIFKEQVESVRETNDDDKLFSLP